MTSEEFRSARHKLKLSVAETAKIFHVEPAHVRRWESMAARKRDIPRGVEISMRLLLEFGLSKWLWDEIEGK